MDCDGHTVTGSDIAVPVPFSIGIDLTGRTGVTVENCHVTNFETGFFLFDSSDNTLEENKATGNGNGFFLEDVFDNKLKDNEAEENGQNGFVLVDSDGNVLEENEAEENTGFGYNDNTTGATGDFGTDNFYAGNECEDNLAGESFPVGLCD